jgi:hypothetical protein
MVLMHVSLVKLLRQAMIGQISPPDYILLGACGLLWLRLIMLGA